MCQALALSCMHARQRFDAIAAALATAPDAATIRTGFAELIPGESAAELIAREDGRLIDSRRVNDDDRPPPPDNTSVKLA